MSIMKLPLTPHKVYGAWILEDATGAWVATIPVSGPNDPDAEADAHTFTRAVNAHSALVSVCRDAHILADDRTDTRPAPCEDIELLSLMVSAGAALALTKETQCTGS